MFIVLASAEGDGRLAIVAPIAPGDAESDDDICWRIAAYLFDASERAAREMDAIVTVGLIAGSLAVELSPWRAEPELIDVPLHEAWDARPSLAKASLICMRELVVGHDLPFVAADHQDQLTAQGGVRPPCGGDLRQLARRMGIPLSDVVAALGGTGLPFPDDVVGADAEETLRVLLNIDPGQGPKVSMTSSKASAVPADRSSPPMIARRILEKLLRDRRVGGRHAAVESIWGHHFADHEKEIAREMTRRLLRNGVLQSRSKGGTDHLSIDPRRIGDAQRIIELRYQDRTLFAGLT